MKRNRRTARFLALLLALSLLLCSCRSSPVLEEVVYTYTAEEVDLEQEMLDPEDEGEEDEDFRNEEEEDLDTERDTEATEGYEDEEDDEETEAAVSVTLDVNSDDDTSSDTTSDTTAQTDSTGTGSDSTDTEDDTDTDTDTDDDTETETGTDTDTEETAADPTPVAGDGEETYKQVVDATGATVDIPENVETVTAVGAAAQMVEMLGGSGRLIGTNSELLSSSLAKTAFSDCSSIQNWWTGDGSSAITDACFTALLAADPDVCFEISGQNTFTDSQVAQLEAAGIAYFVLPALTSQTNLENAVTLVAEVLGTSSDGTDCTTIANQYNTWVESTVSAVSNATSGNELTSLYVAGWDSSATYQLNNTPDEIASSGSGLAYAYSPAKSQLVSTFMAAANVTNESTRQSGYGKSNYVYLTPMFHQFTPTVSGTAASYYAGSGLATPYDLFVSFRISSVYYQLGGASFPAIIVADSSVKSAIESSWFWQYHEADSEGFYTFEESGSQIYRAIAGEYSIYVNPSGMVDWAEGSVESPLEAYWVAYEFYGTYTLDQVKNKTSEFYSTFFGVTLSSSELTAIFGE